MIVFNTQLSSHLCETAPASQAVSLFLAEKSSLLSTPRSSIMNFHVHTVHFHPTLLDCELRKNRACVSLSPSP